MATYDHLPLLRVEGELPRRKQSGFPSEKRVPGTHAPKIAAEIQDVVQAHKAAPKIADVDPSLILKIQTTGPVGEDVWARLGLTVLAVEPGKTVILFADDIELREFTQRVEAYGGEIPEGQKGAPHAGIFDAIESVGRLTAIDRIGPSLRSEGITAPEMMPEVVSTLDVELWPVGGTTAELFVHRVSNVVANYGGEVTDRYRGRSALLMRLRAGGAAFRAVLELPEVAQLERPPEPNWPELDIHELTLKTTHAASAAPADALVIGIIDSGLTAEHPLISGSVVSSFGEPAALGDDDAKSHGTPVTGIAVFGDVRQQLANDPIQPRFRLASAKVVNAQGRFDDEQMVPNQIEKAIRRLHGEFGCRVINLSLGDVKRPAGARPSPWAAVLDDLARELDLVILVAGGNADRVRLNALGDGISKDYPMFLLNEAHRILEPASAINVITVGSIAHANGLSALDADNVGVIPIADAHQPSPFTRIGPGATGAIKPDLVDFGGTAVFDGPTQAIQEGSKRTNAGILSLHSKYLDQLFAVRSGTSFATPMVAYKAGLLVDAFPDASANLIRALLGLSADHPPSAVHCLAKAGDDAIFNALGYGLANVERALSSEDNRVILYREDALSSDRFAVYEVPIPKEFQTGRGRRHIKISLAFDPPVRHTRVDYAGTTMSFRLVRGSTANEVFDAYRKWEKEEGKGTSIVGRFQCDLKPGSQRRERGTLQVSSFVAQQNIEKYGDSYFLAVRCESGWSSDDQRFAVAVELQHEAEIQLYERVRERVRIRV